jgi:hypothetical protein
MILDMLAPFLTLLIHIIPNFLSSVPIDSGDTNFQLCDPPPPHSLMVQQIFLVESWGPGLMVLGCTVIVMYFCYFASLTCCTYMLVPNMTLDVRDPS